MSKRRTREDKIRTSGRRGEGLSLPGQVAGHYRLPEIDLGQRTRPVNQRLILTQATDVAFVRQGLLKTFLVSVVIAVIEFGWYFYWQQR